MNYRHIYHAGNFADVFKHAILALCLDYLRQKPAPFRVIDTHAGVGRYDLAGVEAGKTQEWTDGIGRLIGVDAESIPPEAAAALKPYLDFVRDMNARGAITSYPGSPCIIRQMMRPGDRLVVNELHPDDRALLASNFAGHAQVKVMGLDAWTALKALLPPKERRGLVLIDPPFEARGEFEKLAQALIEAHRRFATGTYLLWYPIKDAAEVAEFHRAAASAPFEKRLRAEILIRKPSIAERLNGCGMLIVNPPFTLAATLSTLGPFLAERLKQGEGAAFSMTQI
jgi:23S rRNA (adenine2030-N6)-methyltransferase